MRIFATMIGGFYYFTSIFQIHVYTCAKVYERISQLCSIIRIPPVERAFDLRYAPSVTLFAKPLLLRDICRVQLFLFFNNSHHRPTLHQKFSSIHHQSRLYLQPLTTSDLNSINPLSSPLP